jgi:hypothetical protein
MTKQKCASYLFFALFLFGLADNSGPLFFGAIRLSPRIESAFKQTAFVAKTFLK